MESNESVKRILQLMKERGWSLYKLAKESGITYSSLSNLLHRNTEPTLSTLRNLCNGLGITLSEFFSNEESTVIVDYSREERDLITGYRTLSRKDKELLLSFLSGLMKSLPAPAEN